MTPPQVEAAELTRNADLIALALAALAVGAVAAGKLITAIRGPTLARDVPLAEWKPGDPLPEASKATIDPAKFERYSMDPGNANNNGKWRAFQELGYALDEPAQRSSSAADVMRQLREWLPRGPAQAGKTSSFGPRYEVRVPIIGPNGKTGTLVVQWQVDQGASAPRIITNWLEVHR